MAVDTPATIAILGAGPLGLETALYARFLGYNVVVYDQGEVAEHLRRAGHMRLFSPFAECHSSLGRNAILAQQEDFPFPPADALLTAAEWRDRYLLPLANTDLLADHLRLHTTVLGVTRSELLKNDHTTTEERADWMFRILWQRQDGSVGEDTADVVIDATGVWSQPRWAGGGGLPASGEREARLAGGIETGLPDLLGTARERYQGQQILLIGGGHAAATSALALAKLAEENPATKIFWSIRREGPASGGAVPQLPQDPLAARVELVQQANALITGQHPAFTFLPATHLQQIQPVADRWQVELAGEAPQTLTVDRVLTNVGYRPEVELFRELQVQLSPIQETPSHLPNDPKEICTTEPNFYVLGAKKFGRRSGLTFTAGLQQIRDLFTIIGERDTLDLYASSQQIFG